MNITEDRVPSSIIGKHQRFAPKDALKVLGKKYAKADPSTVVEAIDDFIYPLAKGRSAIGRRSRGQRYRATHHGQFVGRNAR